MSWFANTWIKAQVIRQNEEQLEASSFLSSHCFIIFALCTERLFSRKTFLRLARSFTLRVRYILNNSDSLLSRPMSSFPLCRGEAGARVRARWRRMRRSQRPWRFQKHGKMFCSWIGWRYVLMEFYSTEFVVPIEEKEGLGFKNSNQAREEKRQTGLRLITHPQNAYQEHAFLEE